VGSKFNLTIGAIANAMSKAAGPALQEELRNLREATVDLGDGDIVHTGPGNLPCRYVIHCVCCPWKGKAEQEEVRIRVFSCSFSFYNRSSKNGEVVLEMTGTPGLKHGTLCIDDAIPRKDLKCVLWDQLDQD